jgi:uncharacterized protein
MRSFDLRSLRFPSGRRGGGTDEAWRTLPVEIEPFTFGGLEYRVPEGAVDADLTAARVGDSLTLTLRVETVLAGPCQRCLADAAIAVTAEGIEYVRGGRSSLAGDDDEGDDDDEAYAVDHRLDIERWVRDLIADDLPEKLLCRDACRGLCPQCGVDLNLDPDHRHEQA